jgi:hypothetical protein
MSVLEQEVNVFQRFFLTHVGTSALTEQQFWMLICSTLARP